MDKSKGRPSFEQDKDEWTLGTSTSSRCFEIESWSYVQHKDFQLHLLQKSEKLPTNRPVIPTTERQRLSYFSGYSTSPFKLQITYVQQMEFTVYFWLYVKNVIFRSLPMNYVYSFLAAYSPDEHMYASKMSPLFLGISWVVVLCGFCQLVASVDILALHLLYAHSGFIGDSNPWYNCQRKVIKYSVPPYTYRCFDIGTFLNGTKFQMFVGNLYYSNNTHEKIYYYTAAPQNYILRKYHHMSPLEHGYYKIIPYFVVLWIGAGCFYKQIYKNYLWKMQYRSQMCLNLMLLINLLYILYNYLENDIRELEELYNIDTLEITAGWDLDFFAESFTGPPVIQLLLSRSPDQVNPGRDSALITATNSLVYLFKSLTYHRLKDYVEALTQKPILFSFKNEYPVFFFWPYFYYYIWVVGEFLMIIFFITTFIVEFTIFVITYQLLVEVVVCEWRWARRWVATVLFTTIGITLNVCLNARNKIQNYLNVTQAANILEGVVLFWLYPLGRLMDDIHFYNGKRTPYLLTWSFTFVPFYYIYKIIRGNMATEVASKTKEVWSYSLYGGVGLTWLWVIPWVLLAVGAVYAVFKYLIRQKQNWRTLLRPRPDWGPRDHVTRQLRKQFDSRDYIGSQASRYLSRHLLAKEQTASYRLDVRYDAAAAARRSTVIADSFNFDANNKII